MQLVLWILVTFVVYAIFTTSIEGPIKKHIGDWWKILDAIFFGLAIYIAIGITEKWTPIWVLALGIMAILAFDWLKRKVLIFWNGRSSAD